MDCDTASWNLDPDLLAEAVAGAGTFAAAIVVDLYGQCADYDRIVPLLEERGIANDEDGITFVHRNAQHLGDVEVTAKVTAAVK